MIPITDPATARPRLLLVALSCSLAACGGGIPSEPASKAANLQITVVGDGRVVATNLGLACPTDCAVVLALGSVVTLLPVADTGFKFAGWSGDADCADGSVTLSADRQCTATFTAVPIPTGHRLAAGNDFSLGRSAGGLLYSWGSDTAEALGNGPAADRTLPVSIGTLPLLDRVASSANGKHAAAVESGNGRVWGWGNNADGQLGDGSTVTRAEPVPMREITAAEVTGATAVAVGATHTLILLADGRLLATGSNGRGELGDGTTQPRLAAVTVGAVCGAGNAIGAIAAGTGFSLALCRDGRVRAWGANAQGQLGDGSFIDRPLPVTVGGLAGETLVAVAAGAEFALALNADGKAFAWGSNAKGQLGSDVRVVGRSPTAIVVGGFLGGVAIAAGQEHALVLLANRAVFGWGANESGQIFTGAGAPAFVDASFRVAGLPPVVEIAAGRSHSLAIDSSGSVWAWGGNDSGQLGSGRSSGPSAPLSIAAFTLD